MTMMMLFNIQCMLPNVHFAFRYQKPDNDGWSNDSIECNNNNIIIIIPTAFLHQKRYKKCVVIKLIFLSILELKF